MADDATAPIVPATVPGRGPLPWEKPVEPRPSEFREFVCEGRPRQGEQFYVGPYRVMPEQPG